MCQEIPYEVLNMRFGPWLGRLIRTDETGSTLLQPVPNPAATFRRCTRKSRAKVSTQGRNATIMQQQSGAVCGSPGEDVHLIRAAKSTWYLLESASMHEHPDIKLTQQKRTAGEANQSEGAKREFPMLLVAISSEEASAQVRGRLCTMVVSGMSTTSGGRRISWCKLPVGEVLLE